MKHLMISKRGETVIKTGYVSSKTGMRKARDKRDNEYGAYLSHFIKTESGELIDARIYFFNLESNGN